MGSKRRKKNKPAPVTLQRLASSSSNRHLSEEMRYLGLTDSTATTSSASPGTASGSTSGTTSGTAVPTHTPTEPTGSATHQNRSMSPAAVSRPPSFSSTNFSATRTNSSGRPPLRTVISESPYKPAKRLDSEPIDAAKTQWWLGPVLVLAAAFMMGLGWMHIQRSDIVAHPMGHPSTSAAARAALETEAKVKFYRSQLGNKLNRDRMAVEIQNSLSAPGIESSATKSVDRSMMSGVPLMQENYVHQNYGSATKKQPVPVDHPDARIHYGLQDQQDQQEFDRRVQAEYVREFVENARRDGVNVKLDKDFNVIEVEALQRRGRQPGSFDQGSTR